MSKDERKEELNMKGVVIVAIVFAILMIGLVFVGINNSNKSKIEESVVSEVESETTVIIAGPPESAENEVQQGPISAESEFETDYNITYGEEETTKDYSSLVIGTRYILGDGVRIRRGPGTDFAVYTMLPKYSAVKITDENSDWTEIYLDEGIYYILGKYVGTEEEMKKHKKDEEIKKRSAYYYAFEAATSEDLQLLAKILSLEAEDEPWLGKLAVIEVVMNRVISKNPQWPDTITEVLCQKGQFTTYKNISKAKPTDNDWAAIDYVIQNGPTAIRKILDDNGRSDINSLNYVFFATYKANGTGFVKYGNHYFSHAVSRKYWWSK